MIELDGHEMRVWTAGLEDRVVGEPVVVFESGLFPMRAWSAVLHDVAEFAAVVAYDRAGTGESAWDEEAPTPEHVTDKLRRLLAALEAKPPYVLVGMNWGAPLALTYAEEYPTDVAGMVLLDPWPVPAAIRAALAEAGGGDAGIESYGSLLRKDAEEAPPPVQRDLRAIADWLTRGADLPDSPSVPVAALSAGFPEPPPSLEAAKATPWDDEKFRLSELSHRMKWLEQWALASQEGTFLAATTGNGYPIALGEPQQAIRAIKGVVFPDVTRQIMASLGEDGLEAAVQKYQAIRRRYPEEYFHSHLLMQPGYKLLGEDINAAVRLLELNVEEYANDPYAHFALGEAYAAADRLEPAFAHLQAAVRLGEDLGDSALPEFQTASASVGERLREAYSPLPFSLPQPENGEGETFTLPPHFAPAFPYRGIAQLRFMPGMFDPAATGYFSYVMVWSFPDAPPVDASLLESSLESYFSGMARTFAAAADSVADSLPRADLERVAAEESWEQTFRGRLSAFEPLAAQAPIRLNVRAHVRTCPASRHQVVLFEISPQMLSHAVWRGLGDLRHRFRCGGEE